MTDIKLDVREGMQPVVDLVSRRHAGNPFGIPSEKPLPAAKPGETLREYCARHGWPYAEATITGIK